MSQETKKNAGHANQHLKWALDNLKDAKEFAEKSGDKKLVEKIKTNEDSVKTTKKELTEKLDAAKK